MAGRELSFWKFFIYFLNKCLLCLLLIQSKINVDDYITFLSTFSFNEKAIESSCDELMLKAMACGGYTDENSSKSLDLIGLTEIATLSNLLCVKLKENQIYNFRVMLLDWLRAEYRCSQYPIGPDIQKFNGTRFQI